MCEEGGWGAWPKNLITGASCRDYFKCAPPALRQTSACTEHELSSRWRGVQQFKRQQSKARCPTVRNCLTIGASPWVSRTRSGRVGRLCDAGPAAAAAAADPGDEKLKGADACMLRFKRSTGELPLRSALCPEAVVGVGLGRCLGTELRLAVLGWGRSSSNLKEWGALENGVCS